MQQVRVATFGIEVTMFLLLSISSFGFEGRIHPKNIGIPKFNPIIDRAWTPKIQQVNGIAQLPFQILYVDGVMEITKGMGCSREYELILRDKTKVVAKPTFDRDPILPAFPSSPVQPTLDPNVKYTHCTYTKYHSKEIIETGTIKDSVVTHYEIKYEALGIVETGSLSKTEYKGTFKYQKESDQPSLLQFKTKRGPDKSSQTIELYSNHLKKIRTTRTDGIKTLVTLDTQTKKRISFEIQFSNGLFEIQKGSGFPKFYQIFRGKLASERQLIEEGSLDENGIRNFRSQTSQQTVQGTRRKDGSFKRNVIQDNQVIREEEKDENGVAITRHFLSDGNIEIITQIPGDSKSAYVLRAKDADPSEPPLQEGTVDEDGTREFKIIRGKQTIYGSHHLNGKFKRTVFDENRKMVQEEEGFQSGLRNLTTVLPNGNTEIVTYYPDKRTPTYAVFQKDSEATSTPIEVGHLDERGVRHFTFEGPGPTKLNGTRAPDGDLFLEEEGVETEERMAIRLYPTFELPDPDLVYNGGEKMEVSDSLPEDYSVIYDLATREEVLSDIADNPDSVEEDPFILVEEEKDGREIIPTDGFNLTVSRLAS